MNEKEGFTWTSDDNWVAYEFWTMNTNYVSGSLRFNTIHGLFPLFQMIYRLMSGIYKYVIMFLF